MMCVDKWTTPQHYIYLQLADCLNVKQRLMTYDYRLTYQRCGLPKTISTTNEDEVHSFS